MRRCSPWLVALACAVLLAACSRTTFVYKRLDFLLPWYVQRYVDLDARQEAYLDELLAPFFDWHRAQELPCYRALLGELDGAVASGDLTAADIAAFTARAETAWLRLEERALDWLLALGERLSAVQINTFIEELEERQAELEEQYLPRSDEQFSRDSYATMVDVAGDYLGRLQPAQRDLLRDASERLRRVDDDWLAGRAALIARLAQILEREPGWQARLRALLAQRDELTPPAYRAGLEHNVRELQAVAAAVLNARSARQEQRLRKRLASLDGDLQTLVAARGDATEVACPAA